MVLKLLTNFYMYVLPCKDHYTPAPLIAIATIRGERGRCCKLTNMDKLYKSSMDKFHLPVEILQLQAKFQTAMVLQGCELRYSESV